MRLIVVAVVAAAMMILSAGAAFAGEITGNGKLKEPNGNSPCSFSGQEDLQWYASNLDLPTERLTDPVKGDPTHSQNWGHVKQDTGATGGANSTDAFGFPWGCNGNEFGLKPDNTGP
jgi:hypothetical protein